jgi:hypothetical protein
MSNTDERLELAAVFTQNTVKLDELTKEEWWDVCRRIAPRVTRETFDEMWYRLQGPQ